MSIHPLPKTDRREMPSGVIIDLNNFDAAALRTTDDCDEAEALIAAKMIEIEFQLACRDAGFHHDGRKITDADPLPPLWLPRATKAMAWTKLQKAEVNQRRQKINRAANEARQTSAERRFIEVAREVLPADQFSAIWGAVHGGGSP